MKDLIMAIQKKSLSDRSNLRDDGYYQVVSVQIEITSMNSIL